MKHVRRPDMLRDFDRRAAELRVPFRIVRIISRAPAVQSVAVEIRRIIHEEISHAVQHRTVRDRRKSQPRSTHRNGQARHHHGGRLGPPVPRQHHRHLVALRHQRFRQRFHNVRQATGLRKRQPFRCHKQNSHRVLITSSQSTSQSFYATGGMLHRQEVNAPRTIKGRTPFSRVKSHDSSSQRKSHQSAHPSPGHESPLLLHCFPHGSPTPRPALLARPPLARGDRARHPRFAAFHGAAPARRSTLLDRSRLRARRNDRASSLHRLSRLRCRNRLVSHRRSAPPRTEISQPQRRLRRHSESRHRRHRRRPPHSHLRQSALLHHFAHSPSPFYLCRTDRRNPRRHPDRSCSSPRCPAGRARLRLSLCLHPILFAPRICLRNSSRRVRPAAGSHFRSRHASTSRRARKTFPERRNAFSGFCEIVFLEKTQNLSEQLANSCQTRSRPRGPRLAKSPPGRPRRATHRLSARRPSFSLVCWPGFRVMKLLGGHAHQRTGRLALRPQTFFGFAWFPRHVGRSGNRSGFFFYGRRQTVRIIAHDSVHARGHQHAHVRRIIHRPAHHLAILLPRLVNQRRGHQISSHRDLARAYFHRLLQRILDLPVIQQSGHQCRLDFSQVQTISGSKEITT